ncbi:MAG TPA: HNH endonuclease [Pyrinomonadaceae bacterium]|nr:HNH endonuclease [Pyrinomonadaceae bacterium]
MSTPLTEAEFYRRVASYRYHTEFDVNEREYKIRLASLLEVAREQLAVDDHSRALRTIEHALRSRDNNIVNWRLQVPLFEWFKKEPTEAATSLRELWSAEADIDERLSGFAEALTKAGIRQAGAQLVISSTFLMAISAEQFPPVRMEAFKSAMEQAGHDTLYSVNGVVQRYLLARSFMDWMVQDSQRYQVALRDPLDAQGVIWCLSDGWRTIPVPPDWIDNPAARQALEDFEYRSALAELANETGVDELTPTEKDALVKSRRGQGKFREAILSYWGNCAVSDCCELTLLRASHIKPWKDSTNAERLDGNNGLLLNPNLDAACDKGLITFGDDGKIILSPVFSADDRRALGINSMLRLRKITAAHTSYLRHHREHVFKKREKKNRTIKVRDQ